MSPCQEQWPPQCPDCDDPAACWFRSMVDAISAEDIEAAGRAFRGLAGHGWLVDHFETAPPTPRQQDDAIFWFTQLDLVAAHGKFGEALRVLARLAELGWVAYPIPTRKPCRGRCEGGGR